MKIIRFKELKFIPASHEDPQVPGVLKKVLFKKGDLLKGEIPMINWCQLGVGKSFQAHYHESMKEIFIILNGQASIKIDNEEEELGKGDAVVIPMRKVHVMKNIGNEQVEYIALGIASAKSGKTIVV